MRLGVQSCWSHNHRNIFRQCWLLQLRNKDEHHPWIWKQLGWGNLYLLCWEGSWWNYLKPQQGRKHSRMLWTLENCNNANIERTNGFIFFNNNKSPLWFWKTLQDSLLLLEHYIFSSSSSSSSYFCCYDPLITWLWPAKQLLSYGWLRKIDAATALREAYSAAWASIQMKNQIFITLQKAISGQSGPPTFLEIGCFIG